VFLFGRSRTCRPRNLWGIRAPTTGLSIDATVLVAILQACPCVCAPSMAGQMGRWTHAQLRKADPQSTSSPRHTPHVSTTSEHTITFKRLSQRCGSYLWESPPPASRAAQGASGGPTTALFSNDWPSTEVQQACEMARTYWRNGRVPTGEMARTYWRNNII
jgi:hypothetical protein